MLLLFFLIVHGAASSSVTENSCAAYSSSSRQVNLQINSKRDQDGEWLTTFEALKSDGSTDNFVVDVTQTVHNCAGGQAVQIKGVLHGNRKANISYDTLTFHPNCGFNAAISNDGKSVSKINENHPVDGTVLTNRPLRRGELFEVRLDKKLSAHVHCWSIGITTFTPENIQMPSLMWNLKSGNWMYYSAHSSKNGAYTTSNYGKDINTLQVGDRIGVLVNNFGVLHYFVNGVDQGPAASNIPKMVYGVSELYDNAAAMTIVDPSS